MANLAIDFSKAAVETLVANAKSAIEEEEELWQSLQRDLVFIQDEFEMMQSFLSTADGARTKNNVVSTWVRHVCDLSYQVEDCAEFLSHLDTKRSWLALWLRFMRKSCCCCCCMSAQPLDQAVAEIKLIKARVEEVSQRSMRYNLINDSAGTKPVMLVEYTGADSTRKLDILIKARDAAKELTGFLDLSGLITKKDNALQVISVWGPGDDVGTKSIIKEAYDDPRVCRSFGRRAWVKLMHPFNPHEFIRSLLLQFSANTDAPVAGTGVEATHGADPPKQFGQQVNEKRYLVVLEDPSSVAELHDVRSYLQDRMNGSRIVVSTHHLDIAISSSGHPCHILELKQLSESNSVCVFFKEGLHRDELGYMCGPSFRPERPNYFVGPPQKSYFVGRNSLVSELSKMISSRKDDGKPCVVSVWGFAGIGKSALVSNVYRAMDKTFDQYAWVNVSHPINLMGLSWSILLNMLPESDRVEDPIQECQELLRRCNKYLLVIDGLQSKEDWNLINTQILCGCSGQDALKPGEHQEFQRCIVVITDQNVAGYPAMSKGDAVCYVPGLKESDAKSLFGQVVCGHTRSSVNKYMINEEAKPLLYKCHGFPKVITALALYLAHLLTRGDVRDSEGRRLNANFIHELETNQDLKDLFAYPQPQLLQKCFFYLSVFPLKSTIRRRRLVRRWIAEGYSKGTGSNSVEESAVKLVDKLLLLGIIQRSNASPTLSSAKRMTSCQVNSSFLEYIISRQMEEKVFIPLEISVLKENCSPTTERMGQHLAIWECWERDEFVFNSLDFSRLRSLTVSGKWQSFLISDKMRVLRVLDLEGSSDLKSSELKEMVQRLTRLKFLSLRGCDNITYLPDSLGDLSQLQTLDIRGTSVGMLPTSIIKLRKLQYIRAGMPQKQEALKLPRNRGATASLLSKFCWHGTRNGGVKAPQGMGDMTALHTLGVVNASAAGGKGILKELKSLTQMRKIGISGINNENIQHLFLAPHLASLSLHFHQENHAVRTDDIDLPSNLRSLKLYGHVENLPQSIKDLYNLTKLSFDTITLKREDIQILGKIEKLRTLCLRVNKVQDDEIQFHATMDNGNRSSSTLFLKLQVLEIACTNFLHVKFYYGAMQKLELLAVRCYQKPLQFSGLEHLFSLKQIRLRGSYEDTFKEALQQQLANKHSNKPILKLEE